MRIIVLDIGGTSIKAAVYENGSLINLQEYETDAQRGGKHIIEKTEEIVLLNGRCDGIGISTAGQVDVTTGTVIHANENIPGYTGMQIGKIIRERFRVPVEVDNDVNAAALGEGVFGAGRNERNYLCLTYGTGVGGAVVIDGRIYRGCSGSAGEFGSMIIHGEKVRAGRRISGCYEDYASTAALVRKVQTVCPELSSGREIFLNMDIPEVKRIIDDWICEIAHGLVSLVHIFNPECIILGGGVMNQTYVADAVRKNVKERVMHSFSNVRIRQAELGNSAGLWGMAYLTAGKIRDIRLTDPQ
ncbi:ROK family protein [Ruminococcus sp. CLA-AA-H200]|uniref:ROK family protein n=1 Tax=Ruminococcus turbiniformis TaxID=2881258 RepID=A0ABS8G1W4_9FIRM|nr:ROK family protein [Ruminococcus turbiniformis]MCC2256256.1 ROK family protein [Ruminococcus turbiniformis]